MHLLAEDFARRGLPTLRFDYRGEGDSIGDANDPDCVARWRADATAAIETLRRLSGVDEIALVGLRFGSLLAAEVAAGRDDVVRLAMVAPVAAGKTWLRETRILSRMIQTEDPAGPAAQHNDLGLAGFTLTDATSADISAMDATRLTRSPAPAIMLVEPATGRAAERLAAHFQGLGAQTTIAPFPNYETMVCDPALSVPARDIIAPLAAWLAEDASAASPERAGAPDADAYVEGPGWREHGVRFGGAPLVGVYCEPPDGAPRRTAILAGPGNNHHIGWGRSHVELARALAASGVASLRIDYVGVGDSGGMQRDIYDNRRFDNIEDSIAWLRQRGDREVALIGVCSGAYHGMRAAVRDAGIQRLVLLNQQRYEIDLQHKLSWLTYRIQARIVFALGASNASPLRARALALTLAVLPKIRRLGSFTKRIVRRIQGGPGAAPATGVADATGPAGAVAAGNSAELAFSALSRRGTQVLMVHSPGDPAVFELDRFMGPDGERATAMPGVRKIVLHEADHLLSSRAARRRYEAVVVDFLA
jgi:alpha/beta superfamily hydrolase